MHTSFEINEQGDPSVKYSLKYLKNTWSFGLQNNLHGLSDALNVKLIKILFL